MDNKFVALVLVFFLVFGTFATAMFYDQSTVLRARATQKCDPVAEKSFAVSFPKTVPVGASCEVNVFARCADESGVTGADVSISVQNGTTEQAQTKTDENGGAVFTVKPTGLAQITAVINGNISVPTVVTCESK